LKFLVIGASGFIGSHIFNHIREMGFYVIGTQSKSNRSELVTFDLLKDRIHEKIDPAFFKTDEKVFVIICAALSQIDRCLTEKEISYKINVKNTIQLIKDIREYGARAVFLSTSCVYNGELGYYNEESIHDPANEYGRQKDVVEQFLLKNAPEALILRLDKIVSDDIDDEKHMFADWYKKIQENKPIICIEQLFSPTFVRDVARSIVEACQRQLSGAYNVANPEFFTRVELARQFMAAMGKKVDILLKPHEEFHFADIRVKNSYLDGSKFRKDTALAFSSMREVYDSFLQKKESAHGASL